MAEFANRGVANAGLTTGIIGSALGAMNSGILPNLFGGQHACHENMPVNRYEVELLQQNAALRTEVEMHKAAIYTDQQMEKERDRNEAMLRERDRRISHLEDQIAQQAVWNTAQTGTISCMAQQIASLQGLTRTVISASALCPEVMPRFNSWTAPAAPTTTTT